jgi:hypothetical protein
MRGSRCKIPSKNYVRQRCAEGFNSGVKGLTNFRRRICWQSYLLHEKPMLHAITKSSLEQPFRLLSPQSSCTFRTSGSHQTTSTDPTNSQHILQEWSKSNMHKTAPNVHLSYLARCTQDHSNNLDAFIDQQPVIYTLKEHTIYGNPNAPYARCYINSLVLHVWIFRFANVFSGSTWYKTEMLFRNI